MTVPFINTEVLVEAVCEGVPRHFPAHSCFQALDVLLGRARGPVECSVAGIQMGQVCDLIGAERTTAARMVGPAEDARLEEGAIDDQLSAALEQIEQADLARGTVELVLLLHCRPRHPSTLGG